MEPFITYLLKSATVLVLFYSVYWLLLKKDTFFKANRFYLLFGILISFLVPLFEITRTIYLTLPTNQPQYFTESIPVNTAVEDTGTNWWLLLGLIYLAITFFFLLRFGSQLYSLYILLQKNTAETKDGFKFIAIDEDIMPFSFLKYIVYNPKSHSKKELTIILKHEKVHAYQWHSIDIILANLLTVFQWANPFAWLYKKCISENLEFLADSETASVVSSKKDYQMALVQVSSTYKVPALTTNFYQSFIKKRIVMLNKNSSNKKNTLKAVAIVPLLAVFLWSFNIHEKIEYKSADQKSSTESKTTASTSARLDAGTPVIKNSATAHVFEKAIQPSGSEKVSIEKPQIQQDSIKEFQIIITKNTTVEELEGIKKMMKKEHNASFNYSNLNFNNKGEITGISISYSDKRGNNNNYSVNSSEPISDFVLSVSENGISSRTVMTEEQQAQREEIMAKRDEIISERNEEMEQLKERMAERREEIIIEQKERREEQKEHMKERAEAMKERAEVMRDRMRDSDRVIVKSNSPSKERVEIITADENSPIYYVNGKATKEADVKKISPESIEKINVIKGKRAIKKYGGKAIHGVVEIITKE